MPIITVYQWGQEKPEKKPVGQAEVTPKTLAWAPAETITADDLSRDEILDGAFGSAW